MNISNLVKSYEQILPHAAAFIFPAPLKSSEKEKLIANLNRMAQVVRVEPDENSIPIATIRQIIKISSQRQSNKLIILITEAEALSIESQNSLLKSLEEPPENVHIILCAANRETLLPTVLSRVSEFYVGAEIFNDRLQQLIQSSDKEADSKKFASYAKSFIAADAYARMIATKEIAGDRERLSGLIDALSYIFSHLLQNGAASQKNISGLIKRQSLLLELAEALDGNVNPKSIHARLCTSL